MTLIQIGIGHFGIGFDVLRVERVVNPDRTLPEKSNVDVLTNVHPESGPLQGSFVVGVRVPRGGGQRKRRGEQAIGGPL